MTARSACGNPRRRPRISQHRGTQRAQGRHFHLRETPSRRSTVSSSARPLRCYVQSRRVERSQRSQRRGSVCVTLDTFLVRDARDHRGCGSSMDADVARRQSRLGIGSPSAEICRSTSNFLPLRGVDRDSARAGIDARTRRRRGAHPEQQRRAADHRHHDEPREDVQRPKPRQNPSRGAEHRDVRPFLVRVAVRRWILL